MKVSGWGRYPKADARQLDYRFDDCQALIGQANTAPLIPQGLGRSYGDSALSDNILLMDHFDNFIEFDPVKGVLRCQSGVSLGDILSMFVPKGWFLPVTPGTKFVTVGGAIASDVHGKNHHLDGCFSEFVKEIVIIGAHGEKSCCSPLENSELFRATCGGMGLTGVIVEASLQLRKIESSFLRQNTHKSSSLSETFELFEQSVEQQYSVAWIDCLAKGESMGRSLVMTAEHIDDGELELHSKPALSVPINMPSFLLNQYTVKAFNQLYYKRVGNQLSNNRVHYDPYFYPLDSINHWNRLYGKNGFLQYQFVIPKSAGIEAMATILSKIVDSGYGSFLAVFKLFGQQNKNYLSFPVEGYTLALDFKYNRNLLTFLDELDELVLQNGGRVYLTKDARLSERSFKLMYPKWEEFQRVREEIGAIKYFNSLQSSRLGLAKS